MTGPGHSALSPLGDWESPVEFMSLGLGIPKARAKKFHLPKSFSRDRSFPVSLDLLNYGMVNPQYEGPVIKVLYRDADFLAVDKPSGVHGHPLRYSEKDNVLSWIRSQSDPALRAPVKVSVSEHEKGLLYRLDQGTSGVLILANHQKAMDTIRQSFSSAAKEKTYVALVEGSLKARGEIRHSLVASGEGGKHQKALPFQEGQGVPALLAIKAIDYDSAKDVSRVVISLVTGARHQIRAQLGALGHPLLGDSEYNGPKADRLYLHAEHYALECGPYKINVKASAPF